MLRPSMRPMVNARRSIHRVPELPHDYSEGVPNLMSPGGFSIAWTEYMKLMVEKLNALTVGTCGTDGVGEHWTNQCFSCTFNSISAH
jgi:superoxide dismutase